MVREPFRVKRAARVFAPKLSQDSNMQSGSRSMTAERPGSTPIPISTVPSMSRENTRPGSSHVKRARLEEVRSDELAEAEAGGASVEQAQSRTMRKEPELADGIAAALAKLREKG